MTARLSVVVFVFISLIGIPGAALAVTVGTIGTINQGEDMYRTPVGVYGTVDVGNHEESGDTLEDLVGQGGNAITVYMSDDLAQVANVFTMTTGNTSGGGCGYIGVTQTVNLNATSTAQVCNQINNGINQGCSLRADNHTMDIIGPFLCEITHWEFLTGVVPARATTVDITEVSDAEAGIVDFFKVFVDGTRVRALEDAFVSVSNGAQMAAVIDGKSLIAAHYSGNTLTIEAESTGPIEFTDLHLEYTTPATTTSVIISDLTDADAAAVNQFTLRLDGVPTDKSTLDFSVVNTVAQLATELDEVPGIDVDLTGPGQITIAASDPGHVVFTNLGLHVRPELVLSAGAAEFVENGSVAVDPGLTAAYAYSDDMAGATAVIGSYVFNQDQLGFTPVGGVSGSFSNGTLTLSGSASLADYQTALRSVSYSNGSDDPNTVARTVTFRLSDGVDNSAPVTRTVNVTAVNDAPTVTPTGFALDYLEDTSVPVDSGIEVADPDNDELSAATVSIGVGYNGGEDELAFSDGGGISGGYADGTLTLSGTATVAAYESALRSVTYHNLSHAPDETPRTVSFTVSDGSDVSLAATRQIMVTPVNDPPVVTTSPGRADYPPGQALTVDALLILEDADHTSVDSAKISISGGFVAGEDWLLFTDQNGIAGFYDDATGVLDLIGSATVAEYETALASIAYTNSSDPQTAGLRSVVFEVDDGQDWSDPASKEIAIPLFVDGFEGGTTDEWSFTSS